MPYGTFSRKYSPVTAIVLLLILIVVMEHGTHDRQSAVNRQRYAKAGFESGYITKAPDMSSDILDSEIKIVQKNYTAMSIFQKDIESKRRIELAEQLKMVLINQYINPISKTLRDEPSPSFLQYSCDYYWCGGFGDRSRGAVSCFYLALASGRVFHANWIKYSRLDDYFQINWNFYNISKYKYMKILPQDTSKSSTVTYINKEVEPDFLAWTISPNWPGKNFTTSRLITIYTNSLAGLEGALKNPNYRDLFSKLKSFFIHAESIDLSIFVSAALRIIFANPVYRLKETFERCMVAAKGQDLWEKSIKIGIQMRTLREDGHMDPDHFGCFGKKGLEVIDELNANQPILVFLTTDSENATGSVVTALLNRNVIILTGKELCNQLEISNIDYEFGDNWWFSAKAYLDWYTLTKMDYLIMSRSGFSETASHFSLRPTYRFNGKKTSLSGSCEFDMFNMLGDHIVME